MRILHTSDWHLGRTFHGRVLDGAHATIADHLVDLARSEAIDAVVISGDVYDRAIPPTESVRLLDDTLRRLSALTRVILTSGNHDSAQRLGFGAALLREGLSVRTRTAEVDRAVVIPDRDGAAGLYVYALPYLDPDAARQSLPGLLAERLGEQPSSQDGAESPPAPLLPRSHEAVVSGALRLVAKDLAARRDAASTRVPALVMSHAFVVGGTASPESERDIRVGGVDSVPAGVFTTLGSSPLAQRSGGIDYVALGHLHRPQDLKAPPGDGEGRPAPRLAYSGSPLPLSFPEAELPKSSVLLDIGADGVTRLERIEAPRPFRAVTLRGTLAELLGPSHDADAGHWVRIELHGPMPSDAMARLKERFPNLLAFSRVAGERTARESLTITRASDPLEVTNRFLTHMLERPPSAREQEVITEAYDAVRAAESGAN